MLNLKPHAALVASPGMGHLIPMMELGKRMATHHDFHVTVFIVAADQSSPALLTSPLPNHFDLVCLPPVEISGIVGPDTSTVTKICVLMHESLPALRLAISEMRSPPTALVVDLFGTEAFAVADEFDMLRYLFNTTTAWLLSVTIYSPTLDDKTMNKHVVEHEPMKIRGCKPLRFEDTLEPLQEPNDPLFEGFKLLGTSIPKADGILINTWQDLEPSPIAALGNPDLLGRIAKVRVYPVGPLVRQSEPESLDSKVTGWLDQQPSESVIYVSFGSGGTLSAEQITELAWGLELSEQRFIWVVRPPVENDSSAAFFDSAKGCNGKLDFLPEGFLTRTNDAGLVIPMWAAQVDILSHPSVGGFLSHCGWNSTLESITNGVPMIAWPLYAEQKMNAAMLSEELGVAVRLRASPARGMVERKDIEKVVRRLMAEGQGIRKRVKDFKRSGQKALAFGGSSHNSLSEIARECEICAKAKYGA